MLTLSSLERAPAPAVPVLLVADAGLFGGAAWLWQEWLGGRGFGRRSHGRSCYSYSFSAEAGLSTPRPEQPCSAPSLLRCTTRRWSHTASASRSAHGASAALAVLVALTGLTMVLPNLAAQELGPLYNKAQLVFAGLASLVLYFAFVFIQTVRHRDYFLPVKTSTPEEHAPPPDNKTTALSAVLLVVSLVAIVGLAKVLTPTVEGAIGYLQVPKAVVGTIIAALVLLPEAVAAIKAAQSDRLQTSLNLALGSALATIGLTIPAVAAVSIAMGYRLELGLETKELGLLVLTLLLSVITLGTGRTTVLQGVVHLVIFAAFLFFAVVP